MIEEVKNENIQEMRYHPDQLLTEEQLCKELHLTKKTLANWRWQGKEGPSYIKVGGKCLYMYKDVLKYIDANRVHTHQSRTLN